MFDLSFMLNDDTVENVDDTPKTDEELVEEGSDIEVADTELSAKALVFSRGLDEIVKIRNHIATFGVDRALLSLYNDKGQLSRCFNINIPSCESFDEPASPSSALSIACLEALHSHQDGIVNRIKDFVLELIAKIKNIVSKFWQWLKNIFANTRSKFRKYEAIRKGSVVDVLKSGEGSVSIDIPRKFAGADINWNIASDITMDIRDFNRQMAVGKFSSSDKITTLINNFVKIKQDRKIISVDFKNAKKVTEKLEKDINLAYDNENRLLECERELTSLLKKAEVDTRKVQAEDVEGANRAKKSIIVLKQRQSAIQRFLAVYTAHVRGMVSAYVRLVSTFYRKSEPRLS